MENVFTFHSVKEPSNSPIFLHFQGNGEGKSQYFNKVGMNDYDNRYIFNCCPIGREGREKTGIRGIMGQSINRMWFAGR